MGGGLRTLKLGGQQVVAGYSQDEVAAGWQGHHLLPWPNRVHGGRWTWDGRELQLPLSEPEAGNALHGLVCWNVWDVVEAGADHAVLRTEVPPQPGWPGWLAVTVRWQLQPGELSAELVVRNDGSAALPFGYGAHPYVAAPSGGLDDLVLHIPGHVQSPVAAETSYDFATARPIGATILDHCYSHLARRGDGTVVVRVGDVEVWGDDSFRWFQVYSGEHLPPDQRRRSLAVEPMTCPPEALRTGTDLIVLDPGGTWTGRWGIRLGT